MSIVQTFIVPHPPLIIPAIGEGRETEIQATIDAYHEIAREIARIKPDTIILTSPHSAFLPDYIHISPGESASGDFSQFGCPKVRMSVQYDSDFAWKLSLLAESKGIPAGTQEERDPSLDHGVLVPLFFVNKYYKDYRLVRIGISGLSYETHYELGICIAEIAEQSDKKTVFIASGDLSHVLKKDGPYGYQKEGPAFDKQVTDIIRSGKIHEFLDFPEDFSSRAAECGLRSFIMMAGSLDGRNLVSKLLSYEGPFGVGYAVGSFKPEQDVVEDEYARLARMSLEHFILSHKKMSRPKSLSPELTQKKAGVFVSLKIDGALRGCIGTVAPTTDCIADEIIQNAVSAGTEDPRFYPVSKEELDQLSYSVDVLSPFEKVSSTDDLDPLRYGVMVTYKERRGLLLPHLDGVNTVDEQLEIALRKGGIQPHENYRIERFEVVRHQ
ncbi:AmmeMemoRadiSam system protein A [Parasporobacterium paucivorans]|uniref:Uncharacterized protein, PH0010 family/AmmeMemoRadiSam system protein A/AmmeMemoRadiSam system protein B n=1 Tax=Parasporobacterium paucivorans DSM 15970 TaxID=1122934 RepID=A0A1M6AA71_9FIRM|nr:AmmeMemoRadiSam system protein A [Parasporobacterium paucivorans]SHI33424.1 uncharacterized protein, PH0010 family/AmmeMemoRadiSam system protein A/AmmeMemoRadiSam system protein B [Parasporobacterium paucivorans DSM 15970]